MADFSGVFSAPTNAAYTTPGFAIGTSTMLDAGATQTGFSVTDDDKHLEGAYLETGTLSTLTNDLTIGGITYRAGSNIEAEFTLTTDDTPPITFIIGRIGTGASNSGSNQLVFSTSEITPGQTYTFTGGGGKVIELVQDHLLCFRHPVISTPSGQVPIEHLSRGRQGIDPRWSSHGAIIWVGRRRISAAELAKKPHLRPMHISRGALGPEIPARDLVVSQQHQMMIDDWRAALLFGEDHVLLPAKSLVDGQEVRIIPADTGVTYQHILLESHQFTQADGCWAESLLPGDEIFTALSPWQLAGIESVVPGFLRQGDPGHHAALPCLSSTAPRILRDRPLFPENSSEMSSV